MTLVPDQTAATPVPTMRSNAHRWRGPALLVATLAYLAFSAYVAQSDLSVQSLVLVAAVFGILAISLDLVAGMLGLYSLGQGGFFGIGERSAAVPIDRIQLGAAAGGNDRARLNMTKEELENLPRYDSDNASDYGRKQGWGNGTRLYR